MRGARQCTERALLYISAKVPSCSLARSLALLLSSMCVCVCVCGGKSVRAHESVSMGIFAIMGGGMCISAKEFLSSRERETPRLALRGSFFPVVF